MRNSLKFIIYRGICNKMCRVKPFWGISLRRGTIFICSASLIWNVICFILMIIVIKRTDQSSLDRLKKLKEIATQNITENVPIETTDLTTLRPTRFRPLLLSDIKNRSHDFKFFSKGLKNDPYYHGRFKDNESSQEYFNWIRDYKPETMYEKNMKILADRIKYEKKKNQDEWNYTSLERKYISWKICAIIATCLIVSGLLLSIKIFFGLYKYKPELILSYLIISVIILIIDVVFGVFVLCKTVGSDKSWNFWMTKYDGWAGILILVSVVLRVLFYVWIWSYYKELKETLKQQTDQYKQKSQEL